MICSSCVGCIQEQNGGVPYLILDPNPPELNELLKKNILDEFNDISLTTYQVTESEILMWTRSKAKSSPLASEAIILVWSKIVDSANTQSWGLLLLQQKCDSLNNCEKWRHLFPKGFFDSVLDSQQVHIRRFGSKRAYDSMRKFRANEMAGSRKIFSSPPTSLEIMRFVDACGCYGNAIEILTPMLDPILDLDNVDIAIQTFFSQEFWYKATGDDINIVLPSYRLKKLVENNDRIQRIYENQNRD